MKTPVDKPAYPVVAGTVAVEGFLAAYFLYFNWDRVKMPFAADDMMNLGIYFRLGIWRSLTEQLLLGKNFYRPMAALFYLPIYYLFGLNPGPYQVAITLIIALNGYVFYRLARNLGCDRLTTALATLIAIYHPGMTNLQYNVDMIYDVLCFLFYFCALTYYVRIRRQNAVLRPRQIVVLACLFICALNSKEMAVTLPIALLSYEAFYNWSNALNWQLVRRWALGVTGRPILVLLALDAIFVYGRVFGRNALIRQPAYTPVFSVARFLEFQKGSLADLLCWHGSLGLFHVAVVWAVITYAAWRKRSPLLRFCWVFIIVSPLPIEFLAGRFQGWLYIPMAGWAILGATLFVNLARGFSEFIAEEPLFRAFGRRGVVAAAVAGAVFLLFQEATYRKAAYINPGAAAQSRQTREVIRQLEILKPRVPSHSKVVFLNDPFVLWDMAFIADLFFRDKTLEIYVQRLNPLSPQELQTAGSIFEFREGTLVQLK